MTPEESQQVAAMRAYYEAQIANLAHEGANKAAQAEGLAIQLKAAQDALTAATKKKAKA